MKRHIALVTTSRSEYGIMNRLITQLYTDADVRFSLLVSGMHLSERFGNTYKEINVPITHKIDIEIEKGPTHAIACAIEQFSNVFKKLRPDIVVLLGDRYETMGIAIAAMLTNIPIAHIHGGEITTGAIDEAIRHSITKMSHLHFTSCEAYRQRVIQLGENPARVFNVGSLGVENIHLTPLLTKQELQESLHCKFTFPTFLITFHPVTLEQDSLSQFQELLAALEEVPNATCLITYPNADEGNEPLFQAITHFKKYHPQVYTYKSLGYIRYLSCLQFVNAVIGNSSSGIIEVPSFKIPTINIGNRQQGRIQASSIVNCAPNKQAILNAIKQSYSLDCSKTENPYDKANTSSNIISILKNYDLTQILHKKFYNLPSK